MARGKIYPHSLVVADKYSAGYCQVKLDSTVYMCICIGWNTVFVFVNSTNTSTNTVLANVRCFYLYGQIYIILMNLNWFMNMFPSFIFFDPWMCWLARDKFLGIQTVKT